MQIVSGQMKIRLADGAGHTFAAHLAERCALIADESMSICAGGPPAAASAWNRSTQTPLAARLTPSRFEHIDDAPGHPAVIDPQLTSSSEDEEIFANCGRSAKNGLESGNLIPTDCTP